MPLINNKAAHVLRAGDVILLPGVNEIGEKEWENAQKIPLVKARISGEGSPVLLEVVTGAQGNKSTAVMSASGGQSDIVSIAEIDQRLAQKMVSETYRLDQLNRWLATETRQSVINALQKQIGMLSSQQQGGS